MHSRTIIPLHLPLVFVASLACGSVWGRPAGLAVTRDRALLVSADANGTTFRVTRN